MQVKEKATELRERTSAALVSRIAELELGRAKGRKIVGYYPGEYMPEELVMAAGAIPLGLLKGGDFGALLHSGRYCPRWEDTFCRAQIGYLAMGDVYYTMMDMYACFSSHFEARIVADNYAFIKPELNIFRTEVPHEKSDSGLNFYSKRLYEFKDRLENLTGSKVTEEGLRKAIELCNRERELLKELSLLRKKAKLQISGRDFIALNHAAYVLDKEKSIKLLEDALKTVTARAGFAPKLRILLSGSALAMSDYQMYDIVIENNGEVVIEHFGDAYKDYWNNVDPKGDFDKLVHNIAQRYFMDKIENFAFRPSKGYREHLVKMAKEFKVDGVIWYQPMYQDNADFEFSLFKEMLEREYPLPLIKFYTEYDSIERPSMETRVETFVDMITEKK